MKRTWLALAGCAALTLASAVTGVTVAATGASAASVATQRPDGDGPPGFWYGTDSLPVTVSGSAPYSEPDIGGAYGGYIGMTGNWAYWLGCSGAEHFLAWSATNSAQADTDYTKYGRGIGTGAYWFMGGPGVDPSYNGTAAEASAWGARQAVRTLADVAGEHVTYPVIWADIEIPGISPAPDNGWNTVYTSPCSGKVKASSVSAALDRADFNGFANYITTHSSFRVGVYSAPNIWTQIFGTGIYASIPNTWEWTYEPETASLSNAPQGWCLKSGGCAQFFGGQTSSSKYALMWQWSGGGGVRNGVGDFDQIDGSRQS
jgi:hypothetical protein